MRDLYQRYGPALRRKAERMLGSTEDAEDVVQTVFIDLMAKRRPAATLTLPYLYRAVTTRCINRIRDGRRRRELLERHGTASILLRDGDLSERVITLDLLTRLLDRLEGPLADVFVYLYLDHLSQAEVAELMATSRKTVGHRVVRIREALAELLEASS